MIIFAADNHYGKHPGYHEYELLRKKYPTMKFAEDNWSIFTQVDLVKDCELLVLNMIAETCEVTPPNEAEVAGVKGYCESGKPLLLLHGSSAAFARQDWWRNNCGLRWVRPNDPDNIIKSVHPVEPFKVTVAKTRHPLCKTLQPMDLDTDEIYTELEQMNPLWILMETTVSGRSYPQCTSSYNQWGGEVINFLPGHRQETTTNPIVLSNITTLIEYLLK